MKKYEKLKEELGQSRWSLKYSDRDIWRICADRWPLPCFHVADRTKLLTRHDGALQHLAHADSWPVLLRLEPSVRIPIELAASTNLEAVVMSVGVANDNGSRLAKEWTNVGPIDLSDHEFTTDVRLAAEWQMERLCSRDSVKNQPLPAPPQRLRKLCYVKDQLILRRAATQSSFAEAPTRFSPRGGETVSQSDALPDAAASVSHCHPPLKHQLKAHISNTEWRDHTEKFNKRTKIGRAPREFGAGSRELMDWYIGEAMAMFEKHAQQQQQQQQESGQAFAHGALLSEQQLQRTNLGTPMAVEWDGVINEPMLYSKRCGFFNIHQEQFHANFAHSQAHGESDWWFVRGMDSEKLYRMAGRTVALIYPDADDAKLRLWGRALVTAKMFFPTPRLLLAEGIDVSCVTLREYSMLMGLGTTFHAGCGAGSDATAINMLDSQWLCGDGLKFFDEHYNKWLPQVLDEFEANQWTAEQVVSAKHEYENSGSNQSSHGLPPLLLLLVKSLYLCPDNAFCNLSYIVIRDLELLLSERQGAKASPRTACDYPALDKQSPEELKALRDTLLNLRVKMHELAPRTRLLSQQDCNACHASGKGADKHTCLTCLCHLYPAQFSLP
jgi:hypothetical protein